MSAVLQNAACMSAVLQNAACMSAVLQNAACMSAVLQNAACMSAVLSLRRVAYKTRYILRACDVEVTYDYACTTPKYSAPSITCIPLLH